MSDQLPLPPPPPSVSARFVTETELTEAQQARAEARKAAGLPSEDDAPYDGRSLWEKLQEHKDKKQEAFDEQIKFKNQFRALDEDEISFLDSLTDDNHEEEDRKKKAIKEELDNFRKAVISRSTLPPPPISKSPLGGVPVASTSSSATLPIATTTATLAPPSAPVLKKKNKKALPGVIVKKKKAEVASSPLAVGTKRVGEELEKEQDVVGDVKETEVDETEGEKRRKTDGGP